MCIGVKPKPWSKLCWFSCLKQLLLHVPLVLQPLSLRSWRRWQEDPNPASPQSPGGGLIMSAMTASKKHKRTFSHHSERELKYTAQKNNTCTRLGLRSLEKGSTRGLGASSSFELNKPRGMYQEAIKSPEPPDP